MDRQVTHKTKTIMRCPDCGQEVKSQVLVTEAWCQSQEAHSSRVVQMDIDVVDNP